MQQRQRQSWARPKKAKTQKTMASFLAALAAAASLDDPKRANALNLARRAGMPPGWTAVTKNNYSYNMRLPCRRHRFCLRKAAFTFLAANLLLSNNNNNNDASNPLWRTTVHGWLVRSVQLDQSGTTQREMMTCLLSETDVDLAGAPAFSSKFNGVELHTNRTYKDVLWIVGPKMPITIELLDY